MRGLDGWYYLPLPSLPACNLPERKERLPPRNRQDFSIIISVWEQDWAGQAGGRLDGPASWEDGAGAGTIYVQK